MRWWHFDAVILFFLVATGMLLVELGKRWMHRRRRPLAVDFAVCLGAWGVVFYGSFVEPQILLIHEERVTLSDGADRSLRVALVSDIHLGPYRDETWARRIVGAIQATRPDVVLWAGDFIAGKPEEADGLFLLRDLSAPYGVFAVTGNHDYRETEADEVVVKRLEEAGVRVLRNETIHITVGNKDVILAGVDDVWFEGNPNQTLRNLKQEDMVVLLAHNPDVVLSPASRVADLILAGHTHGGQIRLPFLGPVPQIPTALGNEYDRGLFRFDETLLFITSGVGETGPRARLFVPPEIAVLEIAF
ncbi:metallophosphoesterase [Candidatus Uhrbacteria bacterium]|nr:metallophosphoesterase [Candidatus Uhrbacteria bacterium]